MPDNSNDYKVKVDEEYLDAFRNFEAYLGFGESIPGPNFNLSSGRGWQKYDESGADLIPSGKLINTNKYTVEGEPVKGYAIGSIVKAGTSHDLHSGSDTVKITRASDGTVKAEIGSNSVELGKILRLGILLVGAGGSGGSKTSHNYKKKEKEGTYITCGGGGGGGGTIWGIVNLEKLEKTSDYFYITVGKAKESHGGKGGNTYLRYNSTDTSTQITNNNASNGIVAYAEGGNGGGTGTNSGWTWGGDGGGCWSTPSYTFFNEIDRRNGIKGASYNYNDVNEGSKISTDSLSFSVTFAKDPSGNLTSAHTSNGRTGSGDKNNPGNIKIPGGASWGEAGIPGDSGAALQGAGGGASCANGWQAFEKGADGYWILFY